MDSLTFIKQRERLRQPNHINAAMTVITLEPSVWSVANIYRWNAGKREHRIIPTPSPEKGNTRNFRNMQAFLTRNPGIG